MESKTDVERLELKRVIMGLYRTANDEELITYTQMSQLKEAEKFSFFEVKRIASAAQVEIRNDEDIIVVGVPRIGKQKLVGDKRVAFVRMEYKRAGKKAVKASRIHSTQDITKLSVEGRAKFAQHAALNQFVKDELLPIVAKKLGSDPLKLNIGSILIPDFLR